MALALDIQRARLCLVESEDAADKETTTMTHTDQMIAEHKIHARQVVEVTS